EDTENITPLDLITDEAEIFTEEEEKHISSYHQMMLEKYDIDYRVLTWKEDTNIDWQAYKVFNNSKVGSQSLGKHGLLLVINTHNDEVRLEVAGNLEPVFTDAFVGYIEKRQMVPFFRLGRVADGVFATSELLRIRAEEANSGKAFDPSSLQGSFGAGARSDAKIGVGKETIFSVDKNDVLAADSPEETLKRLLNAMRARNGRSDLDIYTPETQEFMAGMVVSPAQMDNSAKRYLSCDIDRIVYSEDGQKAVLLHKLNNRSCDPFTFDKGEDGKWRLNLKAIGNGLGHTYGNVWYLHYGRQAESGLHNYYFGFKDYYFRRPDGEQFDHQGFPYYRSWGVNINHVFEGSKINKIHSKDSFAANIGLQEGDMILRWEGLEYPHSNVIARRMADVREGLDVDIVYSRDEQLHHMLVKAPPRPKNNDQLRWGISMRSAGPKMALVHYVT
ncbi:TPM domain-containing protein, partial [Methylophaga sp.]|uniref:TPM domain-containing protein n=1 Tax=Methylophaga sp. TaxID=2024840 RepID=UPI003F69D201